MRNTNRREMLAKLRPTDLWRYFEKNQVPEAMRESITKEIQDYRTVKAVTKREKKYVTDAWNDIIVELRKEIVSESGNLPKLQNEELKAIRMEYLALLKKLLNKMQLWKKTCGTGPGRYARSLTTIPNSGSHWSDWIPKEIKRKFRYAYDAIESTPHKRRKELFEVRDRTNEIMLRQSLNFSMDHAFEAADLQLQMWRRKEAGTITSQQIIDRAIAQFETEQRAIENARHNLKQRPITEPAPRSWKLLRNAEDRKAMALFEVE